MAMAANAEKVEKGLTDCSFYVRGRCAKGAECEFRHCEGTIGNETPCKFWLVGKCKNVNCMFRHPKKPIIITQEDRATTPCYWLTQPGGCKKGAACLYLHSNPNPPLTNTAPGQPASSQPTDASSQQDQQNEQNEQHPNLETQHNQQTETHELTTNQGSLAAQVQEETLTEKKPDGQQTSEKSDVTSETGGEKRIINLNKSKITKPTSTFVKSLEDLLKEKEKPNAEKTNNNLDLQTLNKEPQKKEKNGTKKDDKGNKKSQKKKQQNQKQQNQKQQNQNQKQPKQKKQSQQQLQQQPQQQQPQQQQQQQQPQQQKKENVAVSFGVKSFEDILKEKQNHANPVSQSGTQKSQKRKTEDSFEDNKKRKTEDNGTKSNHKPLDETEKELLQIGIELDDSAEVLSDDYEDIDIEG